MPTSTSSCCSICAGAGRAPPCRTRGRRSPGSRPGGSAPTPCPRPTRRWFARCRIIWSGSAADRFQAGGKILEREVAAMLDVDVLEMDRVDHVEAGEIALVALVGLVEEGAGQAGILVAQRGVVGILARAEEERVDLVGLEFELRHLAVMVGVEDVEELSRLGIDIGARRMWTAAKHHAQRGRTQDKPPLPRRPRRHRILRCNGLPYTTGGVPGSSGPSGAGARNCFAKASDWLREVEPIAGP